MWDCARRFGKQQAVFRSRWKDPPSSAFFGDRVIVLLRIKAQQRQLKTTLAACLPVTWSTVASQPCKYGLQVVLEIDNRGYGSIIRADRAGHRLDGNHGQHQDG